MVCMLTVLNFDPLNAAKSCGLNIHQRHQAGNRDRCLPSVLPRLYPQYRKIDENVIDATAMGIQHSVTIVAVLFLRCMQSAILFYQFCPSVCLSGWVTITHKPFPRVAFPRSSIPRISFPRKLRPGMPRPCAPARPPLVGASFEFFKTYRRYQIPRGTSSAGRLL